MVDKTNTATVHLFFNSVSSMQAYRMVVVVVVSGVGVCVRICYACRVDERSK